MQTTASSSSAAAAAVTSKSKSKKQKWRKRIANFAAAWLSPGPAFPWHEVSVNGNLYEVRADIEKPFERGKRSTAATNRLEDGAIIDVSGATILWRSADGLRLHRSDLSVCLSICLLACLCNDARGP